MTGLSITSIACFGSSLRSTAVPRAGDMIVEPWLLTRAGSNISSDSTFPAPQPADTDMPYPDLTESDIPFLSDLDTLSELPGLEDPGELGYLDGLAYPLPLGTDHLDVPLPVAAAAAPQQSSGPFNSPWLNVAVDGPIITIDEARQLQARQQHTCVSAQHDEAGPAMCSSCSKLLPGGEDLKKRILAGSKGQADNNLRLEIAQFVNVAGLGCQRVDGYGSSTSSLHPPCLVARMSEIVLGKWGHSWGLAKSQPRPRDKNAKGPKRDVNGVHAWNGNWNANSPVLLLEQMSLLDTLGLQPAGCSTASSSSGSSSSSRSSSPDSSTPQLYTIRATSGQTTAYAMACDQPALVQELEAAAAQGSSSKAGATAPQVMNTEVDQLVLGGVQQAESRLASFWGGEITCSKKGHRLHERNLVISRYAFVVHNPSKATDSKPKRALKRQKSH